jgi:hypothetical protein
MSGRGHDQCIGARTFPDSPRWGDVASRPLLSTRAGSLSAMPPPDGNPEGLVSTPSKTDGSQPDTACAGGRPASSCPTDVAGAGVRAVGASKGRRSTADGGEVPRVPRPPGQRAARLLSAALSDGVRWVVRDSAPWRCVTERGSRLPQFGAAGTGVSGASTPQTGRLSHF